MLASTRTVLASRIRAYNAHVQFLLAGTSVCPAGDQRFLPETFGLTGSEAPVVVVDREPEGPRIPTFVTLHLPKPNESGFEKNGARLIAETMRRFPGKAMVASNSLETLHRMQSFLAREPGLAEYSLLLPKNGHTRTQLLEQFAGQNKAILLIPFDYLSFGDIVSAKFLFVTKLQFPNSFLPTVTRLKQALKKRGAIPSGSSTCPMHLPCCNTHCTRWIRTRCEVSSCWTTGVSVQPTQIVSGLSCRRHRCFCLWKTRRASCSISTGGYATRHSEAFVRPRRRTAPRRLAASPA